MTQSGVPFDLSKQSSAGPGSLACEMLAEAGLDRDRHVVARSPDRAGPPTKRLRSPTKRLLALELGTFPERIISIPITPDLRESSIALCIIPLNLFEPYLSSDVEIFSAIILAFSLIAVTSLISI